MQGDDVTASYPVPQPPSGSPFYSPLKARPEIVTKYAIATLIGGMICIVIGIWDLYSYATRPPAVWEQYAISTEVGYLIGGIVIAVGIYLLICGLGMLAGKKWALKISGYTIMSWTKRPDVVNYFGLPAYQSAYPYPQGVPTGVPQSLPPPPPPPTSAPPTPKCPTCGQPLTYIQQYQRWYCQNCKKYP